LEHNYSIKLTKIELKFAYFFLIGSFFCANLNSCAKSVIIPKQSESEKLMDRKVFIANELKSTFEPDFKYVGISFSDNSSLRPNSFYVLDSLYIIKQLNDNNRKLDANLEREIEIQRGLAFKDRERVKNKVEHLFVLEGKTVSEYCNSFFIFDNADTIIESKITERYLLPNGFYEYFELFTLELPLNANIPNTDRHEVAFYKMYKARLAVLTGKFQSSFLIHTFTLLKCMKESQVRALQVQFMVQPWINALLDKELEQNGYLEVNELTETFEIINGINYSTGYLAQVKYSYKSDSWHNLRYSITLDPYLEITNKTQINSNL
jgi:hypothetical protein